MKERLMMILFSLVLGSVLTAVLIVVDWVSTPVIRKNEERTVKGGILLALGMPSDRVEEVFAAQVKGKESRGLTYYVAATGDVAFAFKGAGLWGPIEGVIALQPNLEKLKGITIIRQEETPGLGSRIADEEYLGLFRGRPFQPRLRSVGAGKGSGPTDVDAITGATMSSNAFVAILNNELGRYLPAVSEGGR